MRKTSQLLWKAPRALAALTILAALVAAAPGVRAQTLEMAVTSETDAEAVVVISVNNAPNQVRAFAFEVLYDPDAAAYKSHSFGDLLDNFSPKNTNVPQPGRIIVGALDYMTPVGVLKGVSGPLAEITFDKSSPDSLGPVQLAQLKDDMEGWETNALNMDVEEPPAGDGDDDSSGVEDENGGGGGGGGGCFIGTSAW